MTATVNGSRQQSQRPPFVYTASNTYDLIAYWEAADLAGVEFGCDAADNTQRVMDWLASFDEPPTCLTLSELAALRQPGVVSEHGVEDAQPDQERPVYASHILSRSALRNLPDPEPLIDNVLDMGTVGLIYGKWGTGKSFITQDWGASVATGRNWQGRPVTQRRVLYVAGEGAFGLKGRIEASEVGWNTKIPDGDFAILPFAVNLTRPLEVTNLAALIAWGGYDFIELDTLARCMVGADENSAKDCGIVVDSMARLLAHTPGGRGCVLGVHHAGKDGKTLRGSSAFEGAADTVYFVAKDGGLITLDREKRKDGPQADHHDLKLDLIPDTGSAVISAHNLATGQVDKPERAQRLLSTFIHHFSNIGASKADLRKVADMPDATFYRAVSDLVKTGDLINTGTDKGAFYMWSGK